VSYAVLYTSGVKDLARGITMWYDRLSTSSATRRIRHIQCEAVVSLSGRGDHRKFKHGVCAAFIYAAYSNSERVRPKVKQLRTRFQ